MTDSAHDLLQLAQGVAASDAHIEETLIPLIEHIMRVRDHAAGVQARMPSSLDTFVGELRVGLDESILQMRHLLSRSQDRAEEVEAFVRGWLQELEGQS